MWVRDAVETGELIPVLAKLHHSTNIAINVTVIGSTEYSHCQRVLTSFLWLEETMQMVARTLDLVSSDD